MTWQLNKELGAIMREVEERDDIKAVPTQSSGAASGWQITGDLWGNFDGVLGDTSPYSPVLGRHSVSIFMTISVIFNRANTCRY